MTKDYLNLDGLAHFFIKLRNKFATKDELRTVQDNSVTKDDIATTSTAGLMSADDKNKLNNMPTQVKATDDNNGNVTITIG